MSKQVGAESGLGEGSQGPLSPQPDSDRELPEACGTFRLLRFPDLKGSALGGSAKGVSSLEAYKAGAVSWRFSFRVLSPGSSRTLYDVHFCSSEPCGDHLENRAFH